MISDSGHGAAPRLIRQREEKGEAAAADSQCQPSPSQSQLTDAGCLLFQWQHATESQACLVDALDGEEAVVVCGSNPTNVDTGAPLRTIKLRTLENLCDTDATFHSDE